jgi:phosphoserine aminotransferase
MLANFNPGPSQLPSSVRERCREAIASFDKNGLGILEISHRSSEFEALHSDTKERIRRLFALSNDFSIIFCPGGATQQFSMVPLNLDSKKVSLGYLLSGIWSEKALDEGKKFGHATVVGSTTHIAYRSLPHLSMGGHGCTYVHFTSNNTIIGSQFPYEPRDLSSSEDLPDHTLVCDASSDILSRRITNDKYALIYAGAQKNLGIAGITLCIVHNSVLEYRPEPLPLMLDYLTYTRHDSLYNTIPVFPLFVVNASLRWIEDEGGIDVISARNKEKAARLYKAIDESSLFSGYVATEARSLMNVTFTLPTPNDEQDFLRLCESRRIIGVKGHRLIGGIRVSLYNAIRLEEVDACIECMKEFERSRG